MQHPPAPNGGTEGAAAAAAEEAINNLQLNDQEWPILGRSQPPRVEHSIQTSMASNPRPRPEVRRRGSRGRWSKLDVPFAIIESSGGGVGQQQPLLYSQHNFDERRGARPYRGGGGVRGSRRGGRRARYASPRNRVNNDPAVVMASAAPVVQPSAQRARYAYVSPPGQYIPPPPHHLFVQQQQVEQMYWSSLQQQQQQQQMMAVQIPPPQPPTNHHHQSSPAIFANHPGAAAAAAAAAAFYNQFPVVQPPPPSSSQHHHRPAQPTFDPIEESNPHVGTVRSTAYPPSESDPNLPPMIDAIPKPEDRPVVLRYKPPRPQFDCQTERIVYQVEYYFSDYNLARDVFVRSNMDTRGRIELSLLATFNAIRSEGMDLEALRSAINHSALVFVDEQLRVGKRIRPGVAAVTYPESIKAYEEQLALANGTGRANETNRANEELEKIMKLKNGAAATNTTNNPKEPEAQDEEPAATAAEPTDGSS